MSRGAGSGGDEHGARTVGTGVFLLLGGLSVALLLVSIPLGLVALTASVAAGVLAARRRTSVEGLGGGPVDASERLEGFIVDPLAPDDPEPAYFAPSRQPEAEVEHLAEPEPEPDAEVESEVESEVVHTVDLADLPPLEDHDERDRRIGGLRAAHAEAIEQRNVAIARWHQLAGDDADPDDPEPVIRAHDPQLVFDPGHVDASPTVRTVASFHRSTQARWRVLWATLGADDVPAPDDVEDVLASMLADWDHADAELAKLEAAEARAAARDVLARPIVVVEPSAWVSDARLEQLLSSLPDETDVVVVERAS